MAEWVTIKTRIDGKRYQRKKIGDAWASVWEDAFNSEGWSHWGVYVGDGRNEVACGATRTFSGSKIAATRALQTALDAALEDRHGRKTDFI